MQKINKFKKILIINIFGIGDVLFTTPIIENIKMQCPSCEIGYIANKRTKMLLENDQRIDKVFVFDRDDFVVICKKSKIQYIKKCLDFIKQIKSYNYDCVLDLSLSTVMGLLTMLAGIKTRIGFNYKNRGFFLNNKIELKGYQDKHIVEFYGSLLEKIGIKMFKNKLNINISSDTKKWVESFLKEQKLDQSKILIGLVPGGGASWGKESSFKRWPAEKYAKIADNLIEKLNAEIILFGGAYEVGLCQGIADSMNNPVKIAAGKTNLEQFIAISGKCSLLILNDGGPLHMAVAAGARTVSIFGPVDENVYGPYPKEGHSVITSNVSCRPCYRNFRTAKCEHFSCLNNITVEDVMRKVEELL